MLQSLDILSSATTSRVGPLNFDADKLFLDQFFYTPCGVEFAIHGNASIIAHSSVTVTCECVTVTVRQHHLAKRLQFCSRVQALFQC